MKYQGCYQRAGKDGWTGNDYYTNIECLTIAECQTYCHFLLIICQHVDNRHPLENVASFCSLIMLYVKIQIDIL